MFKHFIITRFNLRQAGWDTNKNKKAVLTEEWYKNRFRLFEDFCFSSLAAQSNDNFEWLVYFDKNTPDKYKGRIKELRLEMKNLVPIVVDDISCFLPSIRSYLAKSKTK